MDAKFFELDAKMEALRAKQASFPPNIIKDYQDRLDVSWIFHDNALEGVVLSYSELKAAIDQRIISDVTLIPMYEEVRNHKLAVDFVRDGQQHRQEADADRPRAGAQALRHPDAGGGRQGLPVPPGEPAAPPLLSRDRAAREDLLQDAQAGRVAGIGRVPRSFTPSRAPPRRTSGCSTPIPWTKNSGKVARLLMNFILIRHGYLPAVIHSIERQRYYEVLRYENEGLLNLVIESLENSIETTGKFLDELNGLRVKRRAGPPLPG